ncbi:MAG: hypothetical protein HGB17_17110 [Syntrophobacteraceae bacterium]|nr:hypothetical protein [Syntrophobacteraceae bacterium]
MKVTKRHTIELKETKWDIIIWLGSFIVLFGLVYTTLYWRIVRFKSPRWMITQR